MRENKLYESNIPSERDKEIKSQQQGIKAGIKENKQKVWQMSDDIEKHN